MYVVNLSFKVGHDTVNDFKNWLKEIFIPEIQRVNHFSEAHIYRLLGHDDEHGITMILQLMAPSKAIVNAFIENSRQKMNNSISGKWQDKVLYFQTILEKEE